MISLIHGLSADQVRELIEQGKISGKYVHTVYDLADNYKAVEIMSFTDMTDDELIQWAEDNPLAPMPGDGLRHVIRLSSSEDYTAYDRGDLCHELDCALGDLIERILHRYMSKEEAQAERRNSISDFADTIINRDKAHGTSNNNPT